jgi:tetratricopeptide (TPR) repeat protein
MLRAASAVVVLASLAVAIVYTNDFNQFRRMSQEASDDIDDYFYDQAEKTVRQLRALGAGGVRVAGLGLLAVLDNIGNGKTSVERMLLLPGGVSELARRYPQANADFMLGKYEEGRAKLQAAIAADPGDAKALYDLARLTARRDGDAVVAASLFARASEAARARCRAQPTPDHQDLLVRVLTADANACTGSYDLARALVLYQEALMLHESPELHLRLAHVHRLLGRGKQGVEHVRRAVALKPELAEHQASLLDPLLERSPDCAPALYSVRASH